MKDSVVLGVDIGGSHLTAALVNQSTKSFVGGSVVRVRVNSSGSAEEILNTWLMVISDIFKKFNISEKRIGIAMPGPFDYEKGISLIRGLNKYESLYQINVKENLASRLHIRVGNILMMNDAACFLHGEVYGGAAQGYEHAIGLTLGTGTGTAIHHHGVTEDANLGPSPYKDSIADEYFSTRWFVKRYKELSGNTVRDVKELTELYGTVGCVRKIFSEFVGNLADFLGHFAKKENPEVIVMGGNIAQCSDLFLADLLKTLALAGVTAPLVKAKLGEDAAILGAASLFKTDY